MKILILVAIFCSVLPCVSQVDGKKPKKKNCRIIFLERPKGAPKAAHLFDGEVSHEIRFTTLNLSPEIQLAGGDITIGMTPNPVEDPENFPSGAPTVKVPANITDFYIIVISDPQNKVFPIKMLIVNAGNGALNKGQTLWINFTNMRISGQLGNESLNVAPKSKVVANPPLRDSGFFKAEFRYQPNSESKFLPIMKKSWWFDATSKHLGFIIDSGGKLPKIFMLRDRPAPKPPKARNGE